MCNSNVRVRASERAFAPLLGLTRGLTLSPRARRGGRVGCALDESKSGRVPRVSFAPLAGRRCRQADEGPASSRD
ncbi:hypothetical protein CN220_23045 [Sinorhizobium meliloti]|nr:hypothetical protein CN220_23045 [Sinorhizobium meliloti]RVO63033.1 hypothetical protein CN087_26795 [Sinorhizobium meliloti]